MREYKKELHIEKSALLFMVIVFLIITVIGFTYAIFIYSKEGFVRNTITTGNITFSFTETSNGIFLENALPISDSVGKKLENTYENNGYFDFNVSCDLAGTSSVQYEIYATKEKLKNELDEKYVKIYLTDGTTDKPISGYDDDIPTYSKLKKSITKEDSKQLYYGSFTNNGVQSFRLRMWIDEDYELPEESENFKININVEATQ